MARATYVLRNGELVEKHLAGPLHGADSAPGVIRDGMDPIQSMADGRIYDSKRAYYRSVREAGCEIVAGETRKRAEYRPPSPREAIKRAMAAQGML